MLVQNFPIQIMSRMRIVVMSPKGANCRLIVYSEVLHHYKIARWCVTYPLTTCHTSCLLDEQTYCPDVELHISKPFPFLCP